jgi:muramidase (phage lysozyme)
MNANRKATLDTIAFSEGTREGQHPLTVHDGYDVIVTGLDGREVFTSFKAHPFAPEYPGNGGYKRPSRVINKKGLTSNAAGRYQHMLVHWPHYRKQLGLPDFGPESQDLWAIQLIRERHALPLIDCGNFREAIHAISNLWASLPGANYPDQHMNPMDKLVAAYESAGGRMA